MEAAGSDQGAKAGCIQLVIAEGVETQGEPVAKQVWLFGGSACSQGFLKMRPGDAEIVLGGSSRQVGPQQAKQKFTAVRVIRLDQEIGQQANRLTVGEGDGSQFLLLNLQSTE